MTCRIGVISLGCAKNLINSEQMMHLLREAGYEVTGETDGVSAVVLNTCGFIESAKTEAIETIIELGQMKSDGQIEKLIVTGCLVQRYKDEILRDLPEIDAVIGVGSFSEIVSAVRGHQTEFFGSIDAPIDETDRVITGSPLWAYLKIAEGCDNRCAFCIIPNIRGRFRSRELESILAEARRLTDRGIRELILVAQDLTRYGLDLYGQRRLCDLLTQLCEIPDLKWLRLHYLYPDDIDDNLIRIVADNDKILKYLDIPIQHINSGILSKMRRRDFFDIRKLFTKLRREIPDVVLRTSVITGLPGEGEEEFDELCEFLSEMKIERAGVFAYSPEDGTPAAAMDRPSADTAMRRSEIIMELQSRIMDEFNENRVGSTQVVLIEGYDGVDYYGRSFAESPEVDGYIKVRGANINADDFTEIRIVKAEDGEPVGEML